MGSFWDWKTQSGTDKGHVLPLFHALTGSDTTSYFAGVGKKTAWEVRKSYPELTNSPFALLQNPEVFTIDSVPMKTIEFFVVLLYSMEQQQ